MNPTDIPAVLIVFWTNFAVAWFGPKLWKRWTHR